MIAQALVTFIFLLLIGCFALTAVLMIACTVQEVRDRWRRRTPRRRTIVVTDQNGGRRYA